MAITNQERVAKALDLLKGGLAPFVEREIRAAIDKGRAVAAVRYFHGELALRSPHMTFSRFSPEERAAAQQSNMHS